MSVHLSASPSQELPGSVIGKPIRYPHVMLCTMGERHCGRVWTAQDELDLLKKESQRREHEAGCKGGLIIARAGQHA